MGSRYLTDMADVCRAAGLVVVEQDGWQTRGRGSGGYEPDRPWCVMFHHTASAPGADPASDAAYMSYNADAAPIANILLAHDGTVWILAAGATNTNGSGTGDIHTSRGVVPDDSMNTYAIGLEIQNSGVGESYPQAQVDAAFTLSNALTAAYGLQPNDVGTHHAYASDRKIDPATTAAVEGPWQPASVTSSGTWSLDDVRFECARRWNGSTPEPPNPTPEPTPTPPDNDEDTDMAFIIHNTGDGQIALVYGDGRVTGLAGQDLGGYIARFGEPVDTDPVVFADFTSK